MKRLNSIKKWNKKNQFPSLLHGGKTKQIYFLNFTIYSFYHEQFVAHRVRLDKKYHVIGRGKDDIFNELCTDKKRQEFYPHLYVYKIIFIKYLFFEEIIHFAYSTSTTFYCSL